MTGSSRDLILFDMDGVILDSAPAIVLSLEAALRENGVPVPSRGVIEAHVGPPLRIMLDSILGDVPSELIERCAASYRSHNDQFGPDETRVYSEALASIPRLAGQLRMRVATSKVEPSALAVMHHLQMASYFDAVHGTLNSASDTKADVMQRAIDAHHTAHKGGKILAMVGDRLQDIEASKALGICSVAVTWGYAIGDELRAAAPDFLVADGDSLLSVISQLMS